MTKFALKGLLGRKLRTALTALAIVLGVAMISGTYVLTDSIDSAFDTIFWVITRQSWCSSGVSCAAAASATSTAISSPGVISPMPWTGMTWSEFTRSCSLTPLRQGSRARARPQRARRASTCR